MVVFLPAGFGNSAGACILLSVYRRGDGVLGEDRRRVPQSLKLFRPKGQVDGSKEVLISGLNLSASLDSSRCLDAVL